MGLYNFNVSLTKSGININLSFCLMSHELDYSVINMEYYITGIP